MRKHKNNQKDQQIPNKSPSPTVFEHLKSPRMLSRDARFGQTSKTILRYPNSQTDKQKNPILAFKANEILDNKHREGSESNHKLKKLSKGKSNDYNNKHQSGDLSSPYQSYFDSDSGLSKQPKQKSNSRSISRRNSASSGKDESHLNSMRTSYQQTIRMLANQNIELKHEMKMMKIKLEKQSQIGNNEEHLKKQLSELELQKQNGVEESNLLHMQIRSLKELLDANGREISQTHYQIYQMKQQVFQLRLDNEKLLKFTQLKEDPMQSVSIERIPKPIANENERKITSETSIESRSGCNKCKTNSKTIAELVSVVENLRFQMHNKTNTISMLCSEVQRIEGQMKMLDKPRQIYKKLNAMIDAINKDVILAQSKQLNQKYKREARN